MPASPARPYHHSRRVGRHRLALPLASLLWLLCGAGNLSALPLDDPALAAQRADFLAAEQALAAGRLKEYRQLVEGLQTYPLLGYLHIDEIERRFASASDSEIAALLDAQDELPPASALRTRWLERAAERSDWATLLSAWQPRRNAELRCQHARALFETGRIEEAMAASRELWLSGDSRPDACDSVFRRWREAGGLDDDLVWSRVALAAPRGQQRLVKYLQNLLPAVDQPLADLWLAVRSTPGRVARGGRFLPDRARSRDVRLYGLKRLAQRNPEQAVDAWQAMRDQHVWSDVERDAARRALGLGFAQEHQPGGGDWLDAIDDRHADELVWEWRAIARLRERDWSRLAVAIERMPASMRDDENWRYWRARAAEQLGDEAQAREGYEQLAGARSFHGFLAADRLRRDYDFGAVLLRFDEAELRATAAIPAIARARELLVLERRRAARREWYAVLGELDAGTLQRAARLAQLWDWPTQAIFTVARASHFDDIEMRFPLLFMDEFNANADAQRIDPAWLIAVARQESAFMADARSPAGALGLMQVMPATGRGIARSLQTTYRGSRTLLDPPTSIRFGAYYLRELLDRFDDHPALAIAAYNAGARRAEHWRPRSANMEADIWIDTVPYRETRRYLQRIFYYTAIYEHRLSLSPTRLSARLVAVPGRPPEVLNQP